MNAVPPAARGQAAARAILALCGLLLAGLLAQMVTGRENRQPAVLPARATPALAQQTPSPDEAYLPLVLHPPTPSGVGYLPVILQPPSPTPSITPTPTATPLPVTPPAAGDWRAYLSYYRAVAHLPPLAENAAWSDGAFKHARYMVENQTASSTETPGDPWYTPEGAAAGPNSLLQLQGDSGLSDRQVLDQWLQWPFHAIAILDPALTSTGFGSYRNSVGTFHLAAALDVLRGLGGPPGAPAYPVKWPDHNTTVYLTGYDGREQPDPLASCPGYGLATGSGLPILLQIGPGDLTPAVSAHSFRRGATQLEHCVFDESTYFNSIPGLQSLGRALLDARDAIVLIPRAALAAGSSYTVSITANGQTHTWTFSVAAPP